LFSVLKKIFQLVIYSGTFHANIVCVVEILWFFAKINTGVTIFASKMDASVNVWENEITS
jgi:hypothetical protein